MIARIRILPLALLLIAESLAAATFIAPPDRTMIRSAPVIVVASALASRSEIDQKGAIETITTFAIDELLKGRLVQHTIDLVEPGGVVDDQFTIIPGVPRFRDGQQYILFLTRSDRGWHVRDMALGTFTLATDVMGHPVAVREDPQLRHEQRRATAPFLDFIRAEASGVPGREEYFIPGEPLIPGIDERQGLLPITTATFSATSYTSILSGSTGGRWNVFPTAVAFTSLGTEPGAPGGGTTAINTAFASWNNEANSNVNYLYAGADPGTHTSGLSASDGANVIAFERDLSGYGVPPFQCSSNSYSGTLGIGGVTRASGTHAGPNGETFFTTLEGDVEMNRGIANCSLLFNNGDFNSGVTHEVGHTLGFRHSDQNRNNNGPCTSDPSLECSNSAIMKAFITTGLNGALAAWDQHAVAAVYPGTSPPPPPPPPSCPPAVFTDDPLVPRVTVIKVIHLAELRNAVNARRTCAGLPAANFTDAAVPGLVVRAIHINELRARLDEARAALGQSTGGYTDTITAGVVVKAVHFQELRDRLK